MVMKRSRAYFTGTLAGFFLALPAHAGMFDFLFAGSAQTGILRYDGAYERPRSFAPRDSFDAKRAKLETQRRELQSVSSNLSNIKKYQAIAQAESVKAALFKDHTLRRGDILVTPDGLVVYDGSRGRFQPLEQSNLRNRPDLQNVAIALPHD
jgi:hypothetical protein